MGEKANYKTLSIAEGISFCQCEDYSFDVTPLGQGFGKLSRLD